jgi:hypothetical protein
MTRDASVTPNPESLEKCLISHLAPNEKITAKDVEDYVGSALYLGGRRVADAAEIEPGQLLTDKDGNGINTHFVICNKCIYFRPALKAWILTRGRKARIPHTGEPFVILPDKTTAIIESLRWLSGWYPAVAMTVNCAIIILRLGMTYTQYGPAITTWVGSIDFNKAILVHFIIHNYVTIVIALAIGNIIVACAFAATERWYLMDTSYAEKILELNTKLWVRIKQDKQPLNQGVEEEPAGAAAKLDKLEDVPREPSYNTRSTNDLECSTSNNSQAQEFGDIQPAACLAQIRNGVNSECTSSSASSLASPMPQQRGMVGHSIFQSPTGSSGNNQLRQRTPHGDGGLESDEITRSFR